MTSIDYRDPKFLTERLAGYASIEECCSEQGGITLTSRSPPTIQEGYDSFGFDQGAMRLWVVTDRSTRAVIFNGTALPVESGPSLNERATQLLDQLTSTTLP